MRKVLGVATLSVFLGLGIAHGQTVVEGRVLDSNGLPVPGSSVEAFPIQDAGFAGTVSWTKVNDQGGFRLVLREGRYEIRAKDELKGYPDPNALLSVDTSTVFPEISVGARDITGIQVKLGSRGGILSGTVRDRATHALIPKAKVTIRNVDRPEAFVEVFTNEEGHFQFTVPSKPLLISATAQGHKSTQFQEGKQVVLSPGEQRTVGLEVDPL